MSSGELPQEVYHRASAVGSGSFGSVMIVYDDDGEEYALKVFEEDGDDNEDEDCKGSNGGGVGGISLGALREISILRVLRGKNSHPNIIAVHDVQAAFGEEDDDNNNNVGGSLAMAMLLFREGSLASSFGKIHSKKQKAVIAHGLLSAVAHLHSMGIMHRDIKSDNVLLTTQGDDADGDSSLYRPVLIDFSLAKPIEPASLMGISPSIKIDDVLLFKKNGNNSNDNEYEYDGPTHTPSVGTPTYRAPEVINCEPYGLASDLWSVGVVLLEMIRGECLQAFKDKGATALVKEYLDELPEGQPFPALLRGLLEPDPYKRWTAGQALQCDLFQKFGLTTETYPKIYLPEAIPLESESEMNVDEICRPIPTNEFKGSISTGDHGGKENQTNQQRQPPSKKSNSKNNKKDRPDPTMSKRFKLIQKICKWMEWANPLTAHAAMTYTRAMSELVEEDGGIDNISDCQILLDCIVVAHKFFETDLAPREQVNDMYQQFAHTDFDAHEFANNEETLFMMMDFCLYPRTLGLGY